MSRLKMLRKTAFVLAALGLSACAPEALSGGVRDVTGVLAERAAPRVVTALQEGGAAGGEGKIRLPDRPLTVDDAVTLAISSNRETWATLHELGIARGRAEQAGLLPNPAVTWSLLSPGEGHRMTGEVGLEFQISAMLLVPQRRGVAGAELSAETFRVAGEVLDIGYRARVAFYEVQARKRQLELRTRSLEAFQASYAVAVELHRAGNISDLDLATRRAAVEAARLAAAEAELTLLEARERMITALGLSGEATSVTTVEIADAPEKPAFDTGDVEKRAFAASLELAEIARRMDAAGLRAGLARTEGWMPHLEGGVRAEHDGTGFQVGAHLTMGLPVFDRGQGREAAARSEALSLRERYAALAAGLRSAVRSALNRVESAAARSRHYRDVLLPARKKVLAETLLHYNAMQLGVFRVIDAERELTETAIAYTDTLLDYHVATAGLEQILAGSRRGVSSASAAATSKIPGVSAGSSDSH